MMFRNSQSYWRARYRLRGDSGAGSKGVSASYKADVLNKFVADMEIGGVIEFGCGDGRQLALASYPEYLGVDISADAIQRCKSRFRQDATKRFIVLDQFRDGTADLAMSIDVIFHLVEDDVYVEYLERLFASAERFVAIYSTDSSINKGSLRHVRNRNVSVDVAGMFPGFERMEEYERGLAAPVEYNGSEATRFLFYRRTRLDAQASE